MLPEAQLERGVFRAERKPVVEVPNVLRLQELTRRVYLDPAIVRHALSTVYVTRHGTTYIEPGLARYVECVASPCGSIAFTQAALDRARIDA